MTVYTCTNCGALFTGENCCACPDPQPDESAGPQPEPKTCILCSADHSGEHAACDYCIESGKLL